MDQAVPRNRAGNQPGTFVMSTQGFAGYTVPMRILIVEDQPDLQRNMARALREELYAVDTASDGEEGLYKAEAYAYDGIILDVMLPRLDGWEVLQRLRKTKSTPVLMLTARDSLEDRVRGLDEGADDYLGKPFELAELFARLRALIRRSAGVSATTLDLGELVLDMKKRTLLRGKQEVPVTAREYNLLEFLALHRGEVVSRMRLYEHLFDEEDASYSNLLDVHVSRIRRKLGKDFILTARGHGYSIPGEHV